MDIKKTKRRRVDDQGNAIVCSDYSDQSDDTADNNTYTKPLPVLKITDPVQDDDKSNQISTPQVPGITKKITQNEVIFDVSFGASYLLSSTAIADSKWNVTMERYL